MKLMIASDIHGSEYYCKKLIDCYSIENPDKLLLLGDILYHGPRNDLPEGYNPKAVIDLLNGIKDRILCVRGNCDTEVDQMVLKFPVMADYCIYCVDDVAIYATHGHHIDDLLEDSLVRGSIVVAGHTHVPVCQVREGYTYINPGSVSIPKEDSHNGYMIFEDRCFVWKDLGGKVIKEYKI